MSSQRTYPTTITIPNHWPPFKPGEVLNIKAPGGEPGLWRTYTGFQHNNPWERKGPQNYNTEVNLHPGKPRTNKPSTPSGHTLVRMGRAA